MSDDELDDFFSLESKGKIIKNVLFEIMDEDAKNDLYVYNFRYYINNYINMSALQNRYSKSKINFEGLLKEMKKLILELRKEMEEKSKRNKSSKIIKNKNLFLS